MNNPANTGTATQRYSTSAHQAVDKLAQSAYPAADRLAGDAHDVVDRVASLAATAAARIEQKTGQLSAARERLGASCAGYVRDNPITALGIAVAAGYLLSRLIAAR